jgi:hypothetical protein
MQFEVSDPADWPTLESIVSINRSDDHSQVIDVYGWITLHSMIVAQARDTEDRARARRMQMLAGLCLDEALKFYEEDNDLPPPEAFFRDASRKQFQDRPEMFAVQRLIDLRTALPASATGLVRRSDAETKSRQPWWSRRKQ